MNITEIPFNKCIGIEMSDKSEFLMMLGDDKKYTNHLNTVHASAQFSLAEATSGLFLLNQFSEITGIVPVVRKVESKYKKPALGKLYSKAEFYEKERVIVMEELELKQKTFITIRVTLFNNEGDMTMQADFEWFITKTAD